ncbi:MAG: hypothetical protein E6Q97_10965 [Desulfurellales bacterium]|nr:MAG: hypothetical protein E6Q97_10965 [Desulfurellales bacterium]
MILCATSFSWSQASDPRWQLIDKDRAIVPIKDLITIAAHRIYLEDKAKSFKDEAILRGKETYALRQELAKKDTIIAFHVEDKERLRGELSQMDDLLDDCEERSGKLRPWATVGKVGTITVSLAVLGIVAERIINSAKP